MKGTSVVQRLKRPLLILALALPALLPVVCNAQETGERLQPAPAREAGVHRPSLRFERLPVSAGAELITAFGQLKLGPGSPELPLVSVLRDTLGDDSPENDRLRYVWVYSYTSPTLTQRAAASVPFFYARAGNRSSGGVPTPVLDLSAPNRDAWSRLVWNSIQNLVLDQQGFAIKASTRTLRHNSRDYRKAHISRGLAALSLLQSEVDSAVFSESEFREIQGRLALTSNSLSFVVDDIYVQRVHQKEESETRDIRGHNWELLRQRAESEGLYFDPLELHRGNETHALLWVARDDLSSDRQRRFSSRFLNIANPWTDERLRRWKGYTETWHVDSENRRVEAGSPGARKMEVIPLAVYGLDHPRIPILLVDFRDKLNPKLREASRRAVNDAARNLNALSRFGNFEYFVARSVYGFLARRRGSDVNQPSRFRSYSQLKLLLSLNDSMSPGLRDEVSRRIETVSLNPLENDTESEAKLALSQYTALKQYAERADGLAARIEQDRGVEATPLVHGTAARVFLRAANILSLGFYRHREKITPALLARIETERSMAFHERFLREVVESTPQIDVAWDIESVRRSLRFIADNNDSAGTRAARLAARVFARTTDEEARKLCLVSLYRIDRKAAKSALLRLYRDETLDSRWRAECAEYLRSALREQQQIASADAKEISRLGL
jgi:hypothetical protein